ncbi:MAG: FoF1 ATP synthase subunit delta/epsilon [Candidatus Krumholzibacteriia bacterium]
MAATFHFKILTPSDNVLAADVVSIVAPGEAGYLGVLANHAPLITTLVPGTLTVSREGMEDVYYRVGGGILRVARNSAVLLSESVEEAGSD